MSITQHRLLQVLGVSALALGLAACGPNDGQTAGQKLDNAMDKTEQAADNAMAQADRAMESAGQKMDQAADAAKDAAKNATDSLGDVSVTTKVNAALLADPELSALKINVDTKDGAVTLNGEALSQAAKDRAEQLASGVEGVRTVNNMLVVK